MIEIISGSIAVILALGYVTYKIKTRVKKQEKQSLEATLRALRYAKRNQRFL